jgi:hypothetical protein
MQMGHASGAGQASRAAGVAAGGSTASGANVRTTCSAERRAPRAQRSTPCGTPCAAAQPLRAPRGAARGHTKVDAGRLGSSACCIALGAAAARCAGGTGACTARERRAREGWARAEDVATRDAHAGCAHRCVRCVARAASAAGLRLRRRGIACVRAAGEQRQCTAREAAREAGRRMPAQIRRQLMGQRMSVMRCVLCPSRERAHALLRCLLRGAAASFCACELRAAHAAFRSRVSPRGWPRAPGCAASARGRTRA